MPTSFHGTAFPIARCAPQASPYASGPCSAPWRSASSRFSGRRSFSAYARCHSARSVGVAGSSSWPGVPTFTPRNMPASGQPNSATQRSETPWKTQSGCHAGSMPRVSTGRQTNPDGSWCARQVMVSGFASTSARGAGMYSSAPASAASWARALPRSVASWRSCSVSDGGTQGAG